MNHSYFSSYLIICLPLILSVVENIIELFVIMFMHNFCSYNIGI